MCQQPAPQRAEEALDQRLGEAFEQVAHRVGAREARHAQHRLQRPVRTQPVGVRQALRTGDDGDDEAQQALLRRNRVGAAVGEGHQLPQLQGAKKLDEAGQSAEGRDGLERGAQLQLA